MAGEKKLWMGQNTLDINLKLFALNRGRLAESLRSKNVGKAVVILQGGSEIPLYNSDITYVFRQEPYFMWSFGVLEPDCYGAVDVETGKSILFVPKLPEEYAIWMGSLMTFCDYQSKYKVDQVCYKDDIASELAKMDTNLILTLNGINSDSNLPTQEATFDGIEKFKVDNKILFPIIANLRVFKTDMELEVLKYVVEVSADAHINVMKTIKPGLMEYQCESTFLHHCYSVGGCRHAAYTCICASGPNSSVLHYGHAAAPNNKLIRDGELCLMDMGASYFGYTGDITCTIPANGKFTSDQKLIYEAVLKANKAVQAFAKPGTKWTCLHQLAVRTILNDLKEGGLLKGDLADIIKANLGAIFMPHGLGHLMGLEVHDVGGYLPDQPPRPKTPGMNKLRFARILEKGMVITIEPGCYFIDVLLDKALADSTQSAFIVPEVLERFRGFGGVRIEDDIVITEDGMVNLSGKVPRSVEDIEKIMSVESC